MSVINTRARLAKMLPLLGSDKPGERDAAALAVTRVMATAGLSWDDVLVGKPVPHREPLQGTWRQICALCLAKQGSLRPWEIGFLRDLPKFPRLSVKQRYLLKEIADRVLGPRDA